MGTKTWKIGASRVVEATKVTPLTRPTLLRASMSAIARDGASEALRQAKDIFQSNGDGKWSNKPSTIARKGHSKPMRGVTRTLEKELRSWKLSQTEWAVGWMGNISHPDTRGRLTDAGLARIHEFGNFPWLSLLPENPARRQAIGRAMARSARLRLIEPRGTLARQRAERQAMRAFREAFP